MANATWDRLSLSLVAPPVDVDDNPQLALGSPEDYINAVFKRPHGHTEYRLVSVSTEYREYGWTRTLICICATADGVRFVPWRSLRKMDLLSIRLPQWS